MCMAQISENEMQEYKFCGFIDFISFGIKDNRVASGCMPPMAWDLDMGHKSANRPTLRIFPH